MEKFYNKFITMGISVFCIIITFNLESLCYLFQLLEMLMNNCGEPIHKQVIDNGLLPILVKIVKKKVASFSLNVGGQL